MVSMADDMDTGEQGWHTEKWLTRLMTHRLLVNRADDMELMNRADDTPDW